VTRGTLALCALVLLALATAGPARPAFAQTSGEAPPPVAAETAPSDATAAPSDQPGGGIGGIDLPGLIASLAKPLVEYIVNQLLVNLLQTITTGLQKIVGAILSSSLNVVTQTPPGVSYAHPKVAGLADRVRAIANAALLLITVWGGINAIVRPHVGATYHTALELLAPTGGRRLARQHERRVDAPARRPEQRPLPGHRRHHPAGLGPDRDRQQRAPRPGRDAGVPRRGPGAGPPVADAPGAGRRPDRFVAPLGLLCWVLPHTQGWARLWSSTFAAAVLTQFLQVVALTLGGDLLAQAAPGSADAAAVTPFLGVAALALALKIPGLVRVQLSQGVAASPTQGVSLGAAASVARSPAGRVAAPGVRR